VLVHPCRAAIASLALPPPPLLTAQAGIADVRITMDVLQGASRRLDHKPDADEVAAGGAHGGTLLARL